MNEPCNQVDGDLSRLLQRMENSEDSDKALFDSVFGRFPDDLKHVERLMVVASRLELYVRCRRTWRGK